MDALPRLVAAPRRIRVCHIMSADLWAGAEVQMATAASYLVERADVDLTAVLLNEGPLADELRRLGVPVTVIDERRESALGIFVSLVRYLRSHPVDVVHTHRCKDTVLGAIAARLAGVPGVIRTVHGQSEPLRGWPWVKYRIYEALDTLTLRCFADKIVAVSGRMAEELGQSGHEPERVVCIHNGVDLRRVQTGRTREDVRRELGVGPDALLIGTVGRLSPVKGQAHLLRAARLILQKEPGARVVIVGEGPLRDGLLSLAKELEIDHACRFVGPRMDVYDLVAAMDVFVLPSLAEGIPMALLEAMALGTPVVATDVGGVPEIVKHRATGLLVRSRDEQGLAEACLELARDPHWAGTLGARARRAVEEGFSHEQNGLALARTYRSIARGRKAARGLRGLAPLARGARRAGAAAASFSQRRRMERIRREPSVLVAALRSARRILIVCHGNIIRSPFAERLIARALGGDSPMRISSAGLGATPRTPSPPAATRVAAGLDVDLSGHASARVTAEAVAASDVIFVMDVDQLRTMQERFPDARAKTFLLTCLAAGCALEVRDPFDQEDAVFQASFEHIAASVRPIVRLLAERTQCW